MEKRLTTKQFVTLKFSDPEYCAVIYQYDKILKINVLNRTNQEYKLFCV